MPAQSPAAFGRALAKENPEGLPRGDLQGIIEARFGFNTPEDNEALAAYDDFQQKAWAKSQQVKA